MAQSPKPRKDSSSKLLQNSFLLSQGKAGIYIGPCHPSSSNGIIKAPIYKKTLVPERKSRVLNRGSTCQAKPRPCEPNHEMGMRNTCQTASLTVLKSSASRLSLTLPS